MRLSKLPTAQGHEVASFFRNPEQTDDGSANGGESGRARRRRQLHGGARRIEGHNALVWSAGAGGGSPERTYALNRDASIRSMDAAAVPASTGTSVSYIGAGPDHGVPEDDPFAYAQAKAAADESSARAGSRWRSRPAGSRPR